MDNRLRWLVVGQFAEPASGRKFSITADGFAEHLLRSTAEVSVPVAGGFLALSFPKLRMFQLAEVAATLPPASRTGTEPKPAEGIAFDDLMPQLQAKPKRSEAERAVDAFVRSLQPTASSSARPSTRAAGNAPAALRTAKAILQSPPVSVLEGNWRGVKFLLEQCPSDSGIILEVLDVTGANLLPAVQKALQASPFERPDAIFLWDECTDAGLLAALAESAEAAHVPLAATISSRFLGFDTPEALAETVRWEKPNPTDAWKELRTLEASDWLAAVYNPIAGVTEESGGEHRTCWISPGVAVAALLSKSHRQTGSFGRVLGKPNGLSSPAVHEIPESDGRLAIPTRAFLPADAQGNLSAEGVLAVGSGRNTDVFALISANMVRQQPEHRSLPSQIWTGRIIRFSQWMRNELPANMSASDVERAFSDGAHLFLFSNPEAGNIHARLLEENGERRIHVSARLSPGLAGAAIHLEFTLDVLR